MNTHTLNLAQAELEILVDALATQALRIQAVEELALAGSQFTASRELLEKSAAAHRQLLDRLAVIAYPDSDEGASA